MSTATLQRGDKIRVRANGQILTVSSYSPKMHPPIVTEESSQLYDLKDIELLPNEPQPATPEGEGAVFNNQSVQWRANSYQELIDQGWAVEKASLYDEEGVEGWTWTDPNGNEYSEIGDWDQPPPMPDCVELRQPTTPHTATETDADSERVSAIRERVARLERGERDPHVKDWSGAYYSDVYFLLGLLARK